MRTGRKPVAWDRMPRADEMERTIRCNAYADKPPRSRAGTGAISMDDFEPLFAVDDQHHHGNVYVPIDGWPNRGGGTDEVDHA